MQCMYICIHISRFMMIPYSCNIVSISTFEDCNFWCNLRLILVYNLVNVSTISSDGEYVREIRMEKSRRDRRFIDGGNKFASPDSNAVD